MPRGSEPPVYDRIGSRYATTRRPDPRIAAAIAVALGDARTVVNVGAGAGAYEPADRAVVAVEPSGTMIAQRPPRAAPCIQGVAEQLPFRDRSLDASLGVLTIHHWADRAAGLGELRRVARRRVVLLTWDLDGSGDFWLTAEYLPEIMDLDRPRFPPVATLEGSLGPTRIIPVEVPHDLDPDVRNGISAFAQLAPEHARRGLARLADDLRSGRWEARHGALRGRDSLDVGYRLVVAELG